jgi:hypothetical protein
VKENVEPITGAVDVYFTNSARNTYPDDLPSTTKLDVCREIGAVCLVEDNPHEIEELVGSGVVPVCLAWPWNKSLVASHPHVMRGDWPQLTRYLLDKFGAAS